MRATKEQIEQIRAQAWNDVTREIARTGIRLTWEQDAEIGEQAGAWLRDRLGLRVETDADGVTYAPATGVR